MVERDKKGRFAKGHNKSNYGRTHFKKNSTPWNKDSIGIVNKNSGSFKKGEHRSKETEFKKGSKGFTGKHSEKTKRILSEKLKGRVSWNKGITKKDDNRINGGRVSKGIFVSSDGYAHKWLNGKLLRAHRYIWEKQNGKIPAGYVVHHIDGDKLNNNIKNLKLMTVSEHTKLHWKQNDIRGVMA